MQQPPLLPEEVLARVLRTARLNGMSVLIASAFFAVVSALAKDTVGAIAGLVVAGAGAVEVHGGGLLSAGDRRGVKWLLGSQLLCLAAILVYCGVRLFVREIPPIPAEFQAVIRQNAEQVGITPEELVEQSYRLGLYLVAGVSVLYQGGMAVYYRRHRSAVVRAISMGAALI